MPIELLFLLAAVGLFFLGRGGVKLPQLRRSPSVAGPAATPAGGATPTSPATPVKTWWNDLTSWSLITLYGVILGIMALMLILVPTTWLSMVGDTYQTIALTMVLIGLFLLAISSGKRPMVGVMLLAFVFLAFNKPETMAARVETAKSAGVTTIFKPAPPTPVDPEEQARLVAVAKQEAEIVAEQTVIEAAAAVKAEEAEARARADAVMDAQAEPCLRDKTNKLGCEIVKFGFNTKYVRTARYNEAANGKPAKSYCINHDGGTAVTIIPLVNNQFEFTGPQGSVVQFFDLPEGDSYRGVKCG